MKILKGFTLVEMLVVMGILIILMTLGIAAGRFALQRANKIQHQDAANQLHQGFAAYYADSREFPKNATFVSFSAALGEDGALQQYIDQKAFDGGSDSTYYYAVESTGQSMLVCVSYGGFDDEKEMGGYCQGNGFGLLPTAGAKVATKDLDATEFNTQVLANVGSTQGQFIATDWGATIKNWQ
jgi:prepilin-type N-terminal cleavage/methylation domain-containing protein